MYAVVQTGGKQYRVAPGEVFIVERLPGQDGDTIQLDSILMVGEGETAHVGSPFLEGARLTAEIIAQSRAEKIIVFKKKRRQNYRRKNGHRQLQTVLRVTEIAGNGMVATAPAKPQKAEISATQIPTDASDAAVGN